MNTNIIPSSEMPSQAEGVDYFCSVLRAELMKCKPTWNLLAIRLGVNKYWLGRFANGQIRYPPLPTFFKISKALGFMLKVEPGEHYLDEINDDALFVGFESYRRKQATIRKRKERQK